MEWSGGERESEAASPVGYAGRDPGGAERERRGRPGQKTASNLDPLVLLGGGKTRAEWLSG